MTSRNPLEQIPLDTVAHSPVISVVMPAYNDERHIAEAIQSILDQTYEDFEFIIINDGSTDRTAEVIGSFTDRRIVFINETENGGLVKRLNQGFAAAKGTYIARMDADDWSAPRRFEKQITYMQNNPDVCVLGTGRIVVRNNLNNIKSIDILNSKFTTMPIGHPICHPSVMFRRSLWPAGVQYSNEYPHLEDYKLWLDLLPLVKIENLPEPLVKYRRHKDTVSKVHALAQVNSATRVQIDFIRRHFSIAVPKVHDAAWHWLAWEDDASIRLSQLSSLYGFLLGKTLPIAPLGADNIELTSAILRPIMKRQIRARINHLKYRIGDKVDTEHFQWYWKYKIKSKLKLGVATRAPPEPTTPATNHRRK